jgi:branched-chain amino acid transport system substrate-binding protein
MSTGDVVTEPDLANIGESGIGILSTYHYAVSHESPETRRSSIRSSKMAASSMK